MAINIKLFIFSGLLFLPTSGCVVESICANDADCASSQYCDKLLKSCKPRCKSDADCPSDHYCDVDDEHCLHAECFQDPDCETEEKCVDHRCVPSEPLLCPEDMVSIENRFCMDIYEASRPDADEFSSGQIETHATSRSGVKPWWSSSLGLETARSACQNASKRLCQLDEWIFACNGVKKTVYNYGNDYDPIICNSIDTFCYCEQGSCANQNPCPFPHCFDTCSANLHVTPTAAFPDCVTEWGVYDIHGNVWELADSNDGKLHFRGGAFNCKNSEELHRCDHDGDWGPTARGFRCCHNGNR